MTYEQALDTLVSHLISPLLYVLFSHYHEFRSLNIDFISYQEAIDTSSPIGEAMFTIIGAMAKLERDIIVERVKAGMRKAKEQGKRLGRPQVVVDLD